MSIVHSMKQISVYDTRLTSSVPSLWMFTISCYLPVREVSEQYSGVNKTTNQGKCLSICTWILR